jgi:DnaJ-class molecular chaperone
MKCLTCNGKGKYTHNGITLTRRGKVMVSKRWLDKTVKCPDCRGTGKEK